jgi:hypothetical protein
MALGPVELLVVKFPGNRFTGEIAPALRELVAGGTIRVIDLLFVTKDGAGALRTPHGRLRAKDERLRVEGSEEWSPTPDRPPPEGPRAPRAPRRVTPAERRRRGGGSSSSAVAAFQRETGLPAGAAAGP